MIHHGDCVEVMAGMEPESVDAIVCDPPYGLGFMGKAWDDAARLASVPPSGTEDTPLGRFRTGKGPAAVAFDGRAFQAWCQQWAEAAYRVAKPSAYLLAFGGTRTVHRMTVALEDAGWIIRDMLVWGYASGFPKSKASLKPAWEPIVMARKPGPLRMLAIDECRIPMSAEDAETIANAGGFMQAGWQGPDTGIYNKSGDVTVGATPASGRWPANIVLTDPIFDGGVEGVVGGGEQSSPAPYVRATDVQNWGVAEMHLPGDRAGDVQDGYGDSGTYSRFFSIPVQYGVCRYCGVPIADESSAARTTPATRSGTAPESASSPHSSSPNDPARSAASPSGEAGASSAHQDVPLWGDAAGERGSEPPSTNASARDTSSAPDAPTRPTPRSRQPATSPRSTSPSDRATSADPNETSSATTTTTPSRLMCESCADLATAGYIPDAMSTGHEDSPRVPADLPDRTRFLIIPKAARADREPVLGESIERFNKHPTVKPTELMRHLVRLVTPAGGVVLDPFLGSGTTALAAEMEGFEWIGIEREAEYVAIAEARLNGTQRGLGLDVPSPTPRMPKTHPDLAKNQPKQRAAGENYSGRWAGTPAVDDDDVG